MSAIEIFQQSTLTGSSLNANLRALSGLTLGFPQESLSAFGDLPEMVGIVATLSRDVRHRDRPRNAQRSSRLASSLWALGVVTFLLSVVSPYDDAFQQELLRPKSFHVAVRRLSSAPTGTRKSGAVPRLSVVAVANPSLVPMVSRVLRDIEPDTATLLAIRFRSCLALRSPPPID
jgi:hypothetical protein